MGDCYIPLVGECDYDYDYVPNLESTYVQQLESVAAYEFTHALVSSIFLTSNANHTFRWKKNRTSISFSIPLVRLLQDRVRS